MNSPKPGQQPQGQPQRDKPLSQQEKLAGAQAEADRWTRIAANPNLSPQAASVAQIAARSARAEVRLRQKGLAFLGEQTNDAALAQILGMNLPQSQPTPSSPETPET